MTSACFPHNLVRAEQVKKWHGGRERESRAGSPDRTNRSEESGDESRDPVVSLLSPLSFDFPLFFNPALPVVPVNVFVFRSFRATFPCFVPRDLPFLHILGLVNYDRYCTCTLNNWQLSQIPATHSMLKLWYCGLTALMFRPVLIAIQTGA
jgi:hypothetical protein